MNDASTDDRYLVYVVEDDPMLRDMFEIMLSEENAVQSFPDAESCLARLPERKPDLFLLDVGLPGMDGHDLCRRLKEDFETADIPVTFVSGLDDMDARLASYDAGGSDFIQKPFDPSELLRKVAQLRRLHEERRNLREMAGYAQRTAFTAMSGLSELGVVIEFMRKSFACGDGLALSEAILAALEQYGLRGAVQIRLGGEAHSLSAEGADLPLETSILNHVREQGRIFEFRDRGVYNYGGVTILVKNMPLDDPERCGRLRDDLAILAEGADARRQAIEVEARNRDTRAGIGGALEELGAMLFDLRTSHDIEQQVSAQIATEMQQALLNAFVSLGLTETQEEHLAEIVRHYFESLQDHGEYGRLLTDRLAQVAERLRSLA